MGTSRVGVTTLLAMCRRILARQVVVPDRRSLLLQAGASGPFTPTSGSHVLLHLGPQASLPAFCYTSEQFRRRPLRSWLLSFTSKLTASIAFGALIIA